jgi:inhibitor of cysteine peptidase
MIITESHNGQSISMPVGEIVEIHLSDNPTTGYRWSPADLGDAVLSLQDSGFHQTNSAVGSGGNASWTFRAKAAGHAQLKFKRWRPWEGDSSIVDRFSLSVEVLA